MSRWILLLICSGAVLLSTGCGGGGGRGDGDRLSRSEFLSRGNHICSDLNRKEQPDLGSTSKAGIDRNLTRLDSALSDLARLHPPAADDSHYRAFLRHFQHSVAFFREKESLLILLTRQMRAHPSDSHTSARYETLVRPFVQDIRAAANNATAVGLDVCANGLTGGSSSNG
jgi:hypothetical protein